MGHRLRCFDGEESVRETFRVILLNRLSRGITKKEAREAWDLLTARQNEAAEGEYQFGSVMREIAFGLGQHHDMHDRFADPMNWSFSKRYDYQADGFWKKLWPLFVQELKAETSASRVAHDKTHEEILRMSDLDDDIDSDEDCAGCGSSHSDRVKFAAGADDVPLGFRNCPHCGSPKCAMFDMGDDVECASCPK